MRFFLFMILFFCSLISQSQNKKKGEDDLSTKNYEELQGLYYKNQKNIESASLYANTFLAKAKTQKNKIKIADGYHLLSMISPTEIGLKYVDSIIETTKGISHLNYPSRGYLNKGVILESQRRLDEAFEYYLKAKHFAEINNNELHQVAISINIGQLKVSLGEVDKALNTYKENYAFMQKKDIENKFFRPYVGTLLRMAVIYNEKKELDSARIYIDEGLKRNHQNSEKFNYSSLLMSSGVNDYYKENYEKAIDSLEKVSSVDLIYESGRDPSFLNLYLSKCYFKTNNKTKALNFLKKIDSLATVDNYSPDIREAMELLLRYYKKEKNVKKQLDILGRMIVFDSISNEDNNKLNIKIYQKYDSNKLKNEKYELESNLKKQENFSYLIYLILGTIIVGFSFFLYHNYSKRIYYKKKFDLLMEDERTKTQEIGEVRLNRVKTIYLQDELVEEILSKLNVFEKENGFIDSTVTLAELAKKINTNSTYLSKIINHYKGQNFANYVNDLRVEYVIEQIKKNPNYRKYTIKSIGEEIGFNSIQSFSKAFQKKTGIKPSYFIKEIENQ